jgi:hypothetical protein
MGLGHFPTCKPDDLDLSRSIGYLVFKHNLGLGRVKVGAGRQGVVKKPEKEGRKLFG